MTITDPYLNNSNSSRIESISYSNYTLNPTTILNAKSKHKTREGALVRVDFCDCGTGYADCAPWVELGDRPLQEQLSLLAHNQCTPLTHKTLAFAHLDAQHRMNHQSVFWDKVLPKNHCLQTYESLSAQHIGHIKSLGFDFLKLKCGKNLDWEMKFIQKHYALLKDLTLKLRLDFNASIDSIQMSEFLKGIKQQLDVIDFIEDPCPFEPQHWRRIQKDYPVSLALDHKPNDAWTDLAQDPCTPYFRAVIAKPAVENGCWLSHQRIVFTSYMDHPLGQLGALYEAAVFYNKFPDKQESCGLLTHLLFDKNAYSEQLNTNSTLLIPPQGPGLGFGDLLTQEKWRPLSGSWKNRVQRI